MDNQFKEISKNSFCNLIREKTKIEYKIIKETKKYDQIVINLYHKENQRSDKTMTLNELAKSLNDLTTIVKEGFTSLNHRMDKLEIRMDRLEQRMDNLENRMNNIEQDIHLIKQCPTIKKEINELQEKLD